MSCCEKKNSGCCGKMCPGCCYNGNEGFNAVVEWEIYYNQEDEAENPGYIFKEMYYITNAQVKQLKHTGLEGKSFDSPEEMKRQIMERLEQKDGFDRGCAGDIDIIYVNSDDAQE